MELVADTNVVIAAILKSGLTRSLVFRPSLLLVSPARLLEELGKHKEELLAKSGMDEWEYGQTASLVLSNVNIVARAEYASFDSDAGRVSPDRDDVPFFALALHLNCPIWSNDTRLKNQTRVAVYNTSELHELLLHWKTDG